MVRRVEAASPQSALRRGWNRSKHEPAKDEAASRRGRCCGVCRGGLLAIDLGWFGPRLPAISSDPGVPSWVGPDTTVDELVDGRDRKSVGPLYLKWIFLRQTFPSDEAIERLSKYIHDLPCVAEVEMCVPTRGEYHVSVIITPRHGPRGGLSFNSVDEDRAKARDGLRKMWRTIIELFKRG